MATNGTDLTYDPNAESGEGTPAGGDAAPGGEGSIEYYLRDLTEDDVYDRLNRANELPEHLTALESRFDGGNADLQKRLSTLEKGLPTQSALDVEKLTKGLAEYDPKLAEVLGPLLQDAFKVNALDETSLRPHLSPIQEQLRSWVGEQLVMSAYSPEALAEIIPPVKDGRFAPEGQRHKDFVEWYGRQGYKTQQSLLSFGAPYINALRTFERWETAKNKDLGTAAGKRTERLAAGQMPAGQHRRTPQPKQLTAEEEFTAGFDEAQKEVAR